MMAFFLVMWLVGATTNKQRAAISEYFKNPGAIPGKSVSPAPGPNGPGGASVSMIKLGGAMEVPRGPGADQLNKHTPEQQTAHAARPDAEAARKIAREAEKKRLDELMVQLNAAIEHSQSLAPYKDQLLLDITPEGLRIQIVDRQNRTMFDIGSNSLKPYTVVILRELAGFINRVPNRISISGHTDIKAYASQQAYTNWELSADRANAARRALVSGGMDADKVARVVGLSSSVPFDKDDPDDPMNRRISIVVMSEAAEQRAQAQDAQTPVEPQDLPDAAAGAGEESGAATAKAAPGLGSSAAADGIDVGRPEIGPVGGMPRARPEAPILPSQVPQDTGIAPSYGPSVSPRQPPPQRQPAGVSAANR
jgi:chemotaxis protein MotB